MDRAIAHDAFAPPGRPAAMRSGLVLALIVHALLIAALAWSVNWRIDENDGVVAELWAPVAQVAAPRAATPEPQPPPAPTPAPAPQPEVRPPPPAPRPDPEAAARAEAQIALEREAKVAREKARRDEVERVAADKARQAERERRDEQRRQEVKREQDRQKERERVAQEEAREKKLAVEKARQKELAEERAREKAEADKARQDEARLAAIREANLKRMMGQAGTGDPSSTGNAARTAGPSSGYAGRIKARIKPNIVLTSALDGNPVAEVELSLAPDGTIVGRKLVKKSASAAWDETVLRAIDRTEVLPRDTDGRVPSSMVIEFRARE